MANSLIDMAKDSKERERLMNYVIGANPNMKNFEDFVDAFKQAFGTPQGEKLLTSFNDDESKLLFESSPISDIIQANKGLDDSQDYDVTREVPKGRPTNSSQIKLAFVPKAVQVKNYSRKGKNIHNYSRGLSTKWTSAQKDFIKVRKIRGVKPKTITFQYNQHFKQSQRSYSSIKTKAYRI